jgi:hypothetical protein
VDAPPTGVTHAAASSTKPKLADEIAFLITRPLSRAQAHYIEPSDRLARAAFRHHIPIKGALALHDLDAAIHSLAILAAKAIGFEIGTDLRFAAPFQAGAHLALKGWRIDRRIG